jgi:hypothetical protein
MLCESTNLGVAKVDLRQPQLYPTASFMVMSTFWRRRSWSLRTRPTACVACADAAVPKRALIRKYIW